MSVYKAVYKQLNREFGNPEAVNNMKQWKLYLGIGISVIFIWMALDGLDLNGVWEVIKSADYIWLLPSVAVYFVGVWVRTWRWDYLLRPLKKIPVSKLFPVVVIGYMGNNVYPFRAGELLRSYVLYRREGVKMSASLATVVIERVFDGLVMLVFVFCALPFAPLPDNADWLRTTVIWASIAFLGALIVFFALAARPHFAYQLAENIFGRLPEKFGRPLLQITAHFLEGLESLRTFQNVLMIFFTSVVIWLLETIKYWFVMWAFIGKDGINNGFPVSFFALMLMNGIVNLATTLPSAPGYVGTFDVPGIRVLTLYNVQSSIAAAYTLVLHVALWLPITLLGGYYMLREGLGWSDFGRAVDASQGKTE